MKPLSRLVSRAALNHSSIRSLAPPSARAARQLATPPTFKASTTCLRCYHSQFYRIQRRGFASEHSKPADSPSSSPPPKADGEVKVTTSTGTTEPSSTPKTPTEQALNGETIGELPSVEERRQSPLYKRFNSLMDNIQGNIFIASQRLNDLTGYSGIEELKRKIQKLEKDVASAHDAVQQARNVYKTTVAERASSQREVTTLLARKDTWSAADLERFTTLYRSDHSNEHAVQEASMRLAEAERHAEDRALKLSTTILARYHEEQIWSDKIRRMSTWGTWGLMGVNVLLFLVFQLGFEPWRRKRLVKGFEDKVREALELERQTVAVASAQSQPVLSAVVEGESQDSIPEETTRPASQAEVVEAIEEVTAAEALKEGDLDLEGIEPSTDLDVTAAIFKLRSRQSLQATVEDLFSERIIAVRRIDLTTVVLESLAAGAIAATLMTSLILRRN